MNAMQVMYICFFFNTQVQKSEVLMNMIAFQEYVLNGYDIMGKMIPKFMDAQDYLMLATTYLSGINSIK